MLLLYTTLSVVGIYLDGITAYQNALPYGRAFFISVRIIFIDEDMKKICAWKLALVLPQSPKWAEIVMLAQKCF